MSMSVNERIDAWTAAQGDGANEFGLPVDSTIAFGNEMLDRKTILSEFDTYVDNVVTGVNIHGTVSISREAQKRELTTAVTNMGTMGVKGSAQQAQTAWRS